MNPEENLYSQIADLLSRARLATTHAVNQTMVYTYYEIGRTILEDELNGDQRAEYGKQVLKNLSARLVKEFGKGFSVDNLERMKKFYSLYSPNSL
ncbi:putative nuclease YhcG [Methanosarcinaceae archaeon Ag5]|uniref:Nuclease YhcG n=1 Tax=Methanolapillus africanus TaxID=3028297 RepID=A0AAE4MI95_9EURY|nr:putative nuclease YhcG [Methanosarcinaceae archaeon Ag5]